jgi:hypothetical protein
LYYFAFLPRLIEARIGERGAGGEKGEAGHKPWGACTTRTRY